MALMRTVHPLDFERIKLALSAQVGRDPNKRGKDALQAHIVSALVSEYLPHLGASTQGTFDGCLRCARAIGRSFLILRGKYFENSCFDSQAWRQTPENLLNEPPLRPVVRQVPAVSRSWLLAHWATGALALRSAEMPDLSVFLRRNPNGS